MFIKFEAISGCMLGLELLEGGLVIDLLILRIMFFSPDSPYLIYEDRDDNS